MIRIPIHNIINNFFLQTMKKEPNSFRHLILKLVFIFYQITTRFSGSNHIPSSEKCEKHNHYEEYYRKKNSQYHRKSPDKKVKDSYFPETTFSHEMFSEYSAKIKTTMHMNERSLCLKASLFFIIAFLSLSFRHHV